MEAGMPRGEAERKPFFFWSRYEPLRRFERKSLLPRTLG